MCVLVLSAGGVPQVPLLPPLAGTSGTPGVVAQPRLSAKHGGVEQAPVGGEPISWSGDPVSSVLSALSRVGCRTLPMDDGGE